MNEGRAPAVLCARRRSSRSMCCSSTARCSSSSCCRSRDRRRPDLPDERRLAALVRAAWQGGGIVDIGGAFKRSLELGLVVMVLTVRALADAPASRSARVSSARTCCSTSTIASLIVPSIVTSLGIALEFRLLDDCIKALLRPTGSPDGFTTAMGKFTSGLGAHLTWTLPFGLLVMFAIFNRFDGRYEEAARDLGATPWQTLRHVVLPIILPSVVGVGLFGFTLSWDEIARSSQAMGEHNTLPMELQALTTTVTTPDIYALGTSTTAVSFAVIAIALGAIAILRARQARMARTPARREARMRLAGRQSQHVRAHDPAIGAAARAAAGAGDRDRRGQSADGPASIEGYYDEVFAVPGLLEEVVEGRSRRLRRPHHRLLRRYRSGSRALRCAPRR